MSDSPRIIPSSEEMKGERRGTQAMPEPNRRWKGLRMERTTGFEPATPHLGKGAALIRWRPPGFALAGEQSGSIVAAAGGQRRTGPNGAT